VKCDSRAWGKKENQSNITENNNHFILTDGQVAI